MRSVMIALVGLVAATGSFLLEAAAAEDCNTGDAAICLSRSACHWDYDRRGCYEGPPARISDACASHGDKAICEAAKPLGCKWSDDKQTCESGG